MRKARRSPMKGTLRRAAICRTRHEPGREVGAVLPLDATAQRPGDTEDEGGFRGDGGLIHGILQGESGRDCAPGERRDSPPAQTWEFAERNTGRVCPVGSLQFDGLSR